MGQFNLNALPTRGNWLAATALGANKSCGVACDSIATGPSPDYIATALGVHAVEMQMALNMTTGATASSTSGVTPTIYHVRGGDTLSATIAAGVTSFVVASSTGFRAGQKIAIGPDGTNLGESMTISSVNTGTNTITVGAATQYAHLATAQVMLLDDTPAPMAPSLGTPVAAANTSYGAYIPLPTGAYWIDLKNTDLTYGVTVEITRRDLYFQ